MNRLLPCLAVAMLGCAAGNNADRSNLDINHRGHNVEHEPVQHQDIRYESLPGDSTGDQQPFASFVQAASDADPMTTSDGRWWCFELGKRDPHDGRSVCVRTEKYCNKGRKIMKELDTNPGKCKPQEVAFCLMYLSKSGRGWSERCLKTGPGCDELYRGMKERGNYEVKPCAEQKNDRPPGDQAFQVE